MNNVKEAKGKEPDDTTQDLDVKFPSKETYRAAIKAFVIVNIIFIIAGMVIIYPVYFLDNAEKLKTTVKLYTEDNQVSVYLMYASATVMSVNGVLGILSAYLDTPLLFDSHEGFTFVSLGLNLIASVTASMVPTRVSKDSFETLFQAETYHLSRHEKFSDVCLGNHMWDSIQESLDCCGVLLGPRDWLFSPLQSLPISCCNTSTFTRKQCEVSSIGLTNNLSTWAFTKIQEILPYVWDRNCIDRLQELTSSRKYTWTLFPLCLLLIESYLMAYSALLVDFIRHYTDYLSKQELSHLHLSKLDKLKRQQIKRNIIELRNSSENMERDKSL